MDASGRPSRVTGVTTAEGTREFDVVVAAVDVPGIKKLLPDSFRKHPMLDAIYELDTVPIATVQVGAGRGENAASPLPNR